MAGSDGRPDRILLTKGEAMTESMKDTAAAHCDRINEIIRNGRLPDTAIEALFNAKLFMLNLGEHYDELERRSNDI